MPRGRDRIAYGDPGNNRRPGTGRKAAYPWRTWAGTEKTWELVPGEDFEDAARFRQAVANKAWRVNRRLAERNEAGWVAYRVQPGEDGALLLTFWWIVEGRDPGVVPHHYLDFFARQSNQSEQDAANARAQHSVDWSDPDNPVVTTVEAVAPPPQAPAPQLPPGVLLEDPTTWPE